MSESLRNLAANYLAEAASLMDEGKYWEASAQLKQAEEASLKTEEYDILLYVQFIKGHLMQMLGAYEEALKINSVTLIVTEKFLSEYPDNEVYQPFFHMSLNDIGTLGDIFYNTGHFIQAKNCFELYLSVSQKLLQADPENIEYQSDVATKFNNFGVLLWIMGRFEESKQRYEKALEMREKLLQTDPENFEFQSEVAMALNNLGTFLSAIGRFEESKQRYEKALKTREKLLQTDQENVVYQSDVATTLNNLGNLLYNMGHYEESKQMYEKALETYGKSIQRDPENLEHQSNVAKELDNLGYLLLTIGRFEESKQRYEKASEIRDKLLQTDPENVAYQSDVAGTLNSLGVLLCAMDMLEESKERYEKALEIRDKLLQKDTENVAYQSDVAGTLNNLGVLLSGMGMLEESKERYEKALEIRDKLLQTDPENVALQSDVADALNNLGTLLYDMGKLKETKQKYEKAFGIFEKLLQIDPENVEYQSKVSMILNNLGNLLYDIGILEESKQSYEKALEIREKLLQKDPENLDYQSYFGEILINLGNVLSDIGCIEEAKQRCEKALEIYEQLFKTDPENGIYKSNIAMALTNLGILLSGQGNYSAALDIFLRALKDYALNSVNLSLLFKVYLSIGRCYEKLGDYDKAFTNYKESIECIESIRSQYSIEEIKMEIMWDKSIPYTEMISLLCTKINDSEKAWEYLERVKSRTLLDLFRLQEFEAPRSLPTEFIAEERRFLLSIRALYRLIRRTEKAGKVDQLTQRIKEKESELKDTYDRIREYSPEYVDLRREQPLGIKEIKDLIGSQEKKTAFVEYYTTADKVFIFVMKSDEKISKVKIVDLTEKSLLNHVLKYFNEIIELKGRVGETWKKLSEYLIDPVFGYIKDCELVYLVPHGLLHYLPLHALNAENRRLIEHFPIVYSPSLTALKYSQRKPSRKLESCLSLGYTPNEDEKEMFEGEAKLVAGMFNAEPKLGLEATSSVLKDLNKDVIHLSCHGGFDWQNSLNSGLILADKDLHVKEIFDLDLNSGLLVLSACETSLNEQKLGDELIVFTSAFLYAGAESLIISLWSVRADSTLEFMERFYKKIKEGNMSKAEAVQQTQIEFIRDEQYSNPYLWAPFVLIGDWK